MNKRVLIAGQLYKTGTGQLLGGIHPASACISEHCVIHNPSDHVMRSFATHWRSDRALMERICSHGIGHPDPDDLAFKISIGMKSEGIHGCDGCCREE